MKFVILTPLGSVVHYQFAHSLKMTERRFGEDSMWLSNGGVSDIYAGRDVLLDGFVRLPQAGIAIWIDSDESWSPEDIEAVIAPIVMGEAEVVAAPYAAKTRKKHRYNFALRLEDCDAEKGYVGPRKKIEGRDYVRIQYAGGGFLAISRAAVMRARASVKHYFSPATQTKVAAVFDRVFVDGLRYGEDYGACQVIGETGLDIWLALDTTVVHYDGLQAFDTKEFDLDHLARWRVVKKDYGSSS